MNAKEKQAYANGVADGKAEEKINLQKKSYQQLKFYDSGYEQGVADLKARLTNPKIIDKIIKGNLTDIDREIIMKIINLSLKQALSEAERK